MHFPNKVFLIGLPASGKSFLGKSLAGLLNLTFIDLDDEIVKRTELSIPEIFEQNGELSFRKLESDTLEYIIDKNPNFVMSTGGGTPCFGDNMALMRSAGTVVFLDVPIQTIVSRMTDEQINQRPMFKQDSAENVLTALRAKRLSYYQLANITVAGDNITANNLAERLKS